MRKSGKMLIGLVMLLCVISQGAVVTHTAPLNPDALTRFYDTGIFDPQQVSEAELYTQVEAEYEQASDSVRLALIATRLLALKWRSLWQANAEMPAETPVVSDPLPRYFRPSENWQWSENVRLGSQRAHYSPSQNGLAQHRVSGVVPKILPVNGTLVQQVYFSEKTVPEQIVLRIETGSVASTQAQAPGYVQARWTRTPEHPLHTENRPRNFWAGPFTPQAGWQTLSVDLLDIGLCGSHRIIRGIEYIVQGGEAWFGSTLIQRPMVEIRGHSKYQVFEPDKEMRFDIMVHNLSASKEQYTLELAVSDYDGLPLARSSYHLDMAARTSHTESVILTPESRRYVVFEYWLRQGGQVRYHGYSAAAMIVPNRTGRYPESSFGMMYWDQPGEDIVEFYEKLGVKLLVIFPEKERLHLFDPQKFDVMPMIWSLPESDPSHAERLPRDVQPYLDAGQRMFSNFWETDLRVLPQMFAPNMRRFYQYLKQVEPAALVGIGGLAWFNIAYVNQLLQIAAQTAPQTGFFDFVCPMLYNTPAPPEFSGIIQESEAFTRLFKAYNLPSIETWNVEWSYFEHLNLDTGHWLNAGVPRSHVAAYTIRHHLIGFGAGITRMIPGTNLYLGRAPLSKNYGHSMTAGRSSVLRYDLTPLPLLPAYSVMTRMVEGKTYEANISQYPNIIAQLYEATGDRYTQLDASEAVLVLWTLFGNEQISLSGLSQADQPQRFRLLSMVGDEWEQISYQGQLSLNLSPEPVYLLLDRQTAERLRSTSQPLREPLLSVESDHLNIAPDQATTLKLIYHLTNPGWTALQGRLTLQLPEGAEILHRDVQYSSNALSQLVARHEQTKPLWLGRDHHITVSYDIRIPPGVSRATYYEQTALTQHPTFPIRAQFESDGEILAQATTTIQPRPPLEMTLRPLLSEKSDLAAPRIQVQIANHSAVQREGTVLLNAYGNLEIEPHQFSFTLPPGESQVFSAVLRGRVAGQPQAYPLETVDTLLNRISTHIKIEAGQRANLAHYRRSDGYLSSFGVGEGFVIEALVQDQQGYETRQSRGFAFRSAVRTTTPVTVDGSLEEWAEAVPLFVHPNGRLSGLTFFAKDYGGEMQWQGLEDFSSAWQMMWDENFLYLAVKTFDDIITPQKSLGNFWNGDTISLQIDPTPNLTDAAPIPQQRDLLKMHTFDCGFTPDGPVMRRKYPTYRHQSGPVEAAHLAVNPGQDGLIYEMAIPWEALSPLHPEVGGWMGLSLVFYEDDGQGRETRSNWFGGSGGNGLAREPRLMGDVHFVE